MGVAASLRGEKSISEEHFRQGLKLAKLHPRCGIIGANCELGLAGLLLGGGPAGDLGKPGGTGDVLPGFPLTTQEDEALKLLRSVSTPLCYRITGYICVYCCCCSALLLLMAAVQCSTSVMYIHFIEDADGSMLLLHY